MGLSAAALRVAHLVTSPVAKAGEQLLYAKGDGKWYSKGNDGVEAAQASEVYVQSRGTNLVTNGTAFLGSKYNFSAWTYEPTDAPPGAQASFRSAGTNWVDEFLPIDPAQSYAFSFWHRQVLGDGTIYSCIQPYDAFGNSIAYVHTTVVAGTLTELAADLNPGDTTVQLVSAANWYNSASAAYRYLGFWDYVDPGGKLWEPETYTRNVIITTNGAWSEGGIVGNTITLNAPYAGPAKAAGTKVSNMRSGGTFIYPTAAKTPFPVWTSWYATFGGIKAADEDWGSQRRLPSAVAKVKIGWLLNYNRTVDSISGIGNVSVYPITEAEAARVLAESKVDTTDPRLSDARTPTAHTHVKSQITDFAHTHPVGDLSASGTPGATTFLRGDGTWATPPDTNTTYAVPTQAEAEAGTDTTARVWTAERVKQAILALAPSGTTYASATQAEAEAGTGTTDRVWTPQRVKQAIDALSPVKSVAGRTGTVTLAKADVGLGSVDNTSDDAKPVSTATQTALNGKANTAHTHPVGDLTATGTKSSATFLRGDNTWATLPPGVITGEIKMWPLAAAPEGYLLLNSTVTIYNIATYPALAALLGTTYGGDGVTTFGVPSMRDMFPLGAGAEFALGATGGSKKISIAQMPGHDHDAGTYNVHRRASVGVTAGAAQGGGAAAADGPTAVGGYSGGTGGGGDYWQPFRALNFIIKT